MTDTQPDIQGPDTETRIRDMEKVLRNMRMAIIIIAAFFVYQSLAPAGFGKPEIEIRNIIKLKELIVIDEKGNERARLSFNRQGGKLVLDGADNGRLQIDSDAISIMTLGENKHTTKAKLGREGLSVY